MIVFFAAMNEDRDARLTQVVKKIWKVITGAEKMVLDKYPALRDPRFPPLPEKLHFIHAEEILARYPDLPRKERETKIIQEFGADPALLIVEVTESAAMIEPATTMDILTRLRVKNFGLSVDDFGTGYSSLAYLARLPLNLLKIDRSFLQHCHDSEKSVRVVAAIIAMAQELNLEVIAEGIEQPEQEQGLRRLGCQLGQGFVFSRPVAAAQLPELFQSGAGNHG